MNTDFGKLWATARIPWDDTDARAAQSGLSAARWKD
jgi:hypothetical protein